MTNDSISDMLTRIRNAILVHKKDVIIPVSKFKVNLAKILKDNGYIEDFEIVPGKTLTGRLKERDLRFDQIKVTLKYQNGKSILHSLVRVSKPGRRVYVTKENLPVVLNKLGVAIISTSKGLMTNKNAHKVGLGGEVICEIY